MQATRHGYQGDWTIANCRYCCHEHLHFRREMELRPHICYCKRCEMKRSTGALMPVEKAMEEMKV